MHPITMPYTPPKKPIKIYYDTWDTEKGEDWSYDTLGILYYVEDQGKQVDVGKYYKWTGTVLEEIQKEEYDVRVAMAVSKKEEEK